MSKRRWSLVATAGATVGVLGLHVIWPQPGQVDYWPWAIGLMAYPMAAALILVKRPGNGVGRTLGIVALASLAIFGTWWYIGQRPDAPLAAAAEVVHAIAVMPQFGAMVALLYVFPTGRPAGRGYRAALALFCWLLAGATLLWLLSPGPLPLTGRANPAGVLPAWTRTVADPLRGLLLIAFAAPGLASLVVRWRRAGTVERAQVRWFVAAAVLTLVTVALLDVSEAALPDWRLVELALGVLVAVALYWALPAAVLVAVTRYRLYEIDRLISRTVTYVLVLGTLTAVYAGGVLAATSVLQGQSEVGVAASTMAVAALFAPLRRRVQARVDHRFNRARYDTARVIDAFGTRLREEVDLDQLSADLLAVVTTTMQPATAGLWIAGDQR
jgi:hypothetical protein